METTVANGKVALVTGSAMGIGLACAEAFAKAGYITVLADIKEPTVQAAKLVEEGYQAVAYRCDVSDTQAVEKMIAWIVATYGRLDAAHNNAGIQTPQRPMAEITDEEFDRTVAVDLKGVWKLHAIRDSPDAGARWRSYRQYIFSRWSDRFPRTGCLHCLQACGNRANTDSCH